MMVSKTKKPYLCHRISPSQIPRANDSIIDAGFFVVPSSLNSSNADACVSVISNGQLITFAAGDKIHKSCHCARSS
ncbi:MAG TPA: hypothetical protein VH796_16490 [Nitrososphaeraceae archaeon]